MSRNVTATIAVWMIVNNALAVSLTAQERPRFEVASIRPSPGEPVGPTGVRITQSEARFSWVSLRNYIEMAFGLRAYQLEGPNWLVSARFEIVAKMPEGPRTLNQVPGMLRALLEERFHLRTHTVRREFPVYGLEVAPKGPPPNRIADGAPPQGPFSVTTGLSERGRVTTFSDGSSLALGDNRFEARRMGMTRLAESLTPFLDQPVVDMTKLEGQYDVAFTLAPADFIAMMKRSVAAAGFAVLPEEAQRIESASVAVKDALKNAGLLLVPRRAALDVLVIDGIDRVPIEN